MGEGLGQAIGERSAEFGLALRGLRGMGSSNGLPSCRIKRSAQELLSSSGISGCNAGGDRRDEFWFVGGIQAQQNGGSEPGDGGCELLGRFDRAFDGVCQIKAAR